MILLHNPSSHLTVVPILRHQFSLDSVTLETHLDFGASALLAEIEKRYLEN
jgi:hypothetical protein